MSNAESWGTFVNTVMRGDLDESIDAAIHVLNERRKAVRLAAAPSVYQMRPGTRVVTTGDTRPSRYANMPGKVVKTNRSTVLVAFDSGISLRVPVTLLRLEGK